MQAKLFTFVRTNCILFCPCAHEHFLLSLSDPHQPQAGLCSLGFNFKVKLMVLSCQIHCLRHSEWGINMCFINEYKDFWINNLSPDNFFNSMEIMLPQSFLNVKLLSRVRLFATPWTVVYQAPPSVLGIFQARILLQEIFPTQGLNPGLPHYRQMLYRLSHQGSPVEKKK